MDRRCFVKDCVLAALALGSGRAGSETTTRPTTGERAPWPDTSGLRAGLSYGLYDNFDGAGAYQTASHQPLAQDGAFNIPDLWAFYGGPSQIVDLGDAGGGGKTVAVDHNGVPLEVYDDPAALAILGYLRGDGGDGHRHRTVARLLSAPAQAILSAKTDPVARFRALAALPEVFNAEGHQAATYLRTSDLASLAGVGDDVLTTAQEIRQHSGYEPGRGPREVRLVEHGNLVDPRADGATRGRFALVPETATGARPQWRHGDRGRIPTAETWDPAAGGTAPPPRRAGERQGVPYAWQPSPQRHVVMMETTINEMRLELGSGYPTNFQDYVSFSADVMIPVAPPLSGWFQLIQLDYHTSIPEQPPGISWLCGIGLHINENADFLGVHHYLRNKNTDWGFWDPIDPARVGMVRFSPGAWLNLRMDIVHEGDAELRVDYFVDDIQVDSIAVPENDAILLLHPTRPRFGPIRDVSLEGGRPDSPSRAFIDNVWGTYSNPNPAAMPARVDRTSNRWWL